MTAFNHTHIASRELQLSTPGMPASDGDGVKMTRIIGTPQLNMLDPFLLLDAFGSDQPLDYIGGFPNHPIEALKQSRICSLDACVIKIVLAMKG